MVHLDHLEDRKVQAARVRGEDGRIKKEKATSIAKSDRHEYLRGPNQKHNHYRILRILNLIVIMKE